MQEMPRHAELWWRGSFYPFFLLNLPGSDKIPNMADKFLTASAKEKLSIPDGMQLFPLRSSRNTFFSSGVKYILSMA